MQLCHNVVAKVSIGTADTQTPVDKDKIEEERFVTVTILAPWLCTCVNYTGTAGTAAERVAGGG